MVVGECNSSKPRELVESPLHWAVRAGLADFLEAAEAKGGLPSYILKEFNAYVSCGDLSRGFVRVKCSSCQVELHVGFSCKGRNVCPSCGAKRAALAAAHLVDEVLPSVPFRQWTLAFPRALKRALAIDTWLLSASLRVFIGALFAFQRRRAKQLGIEAPCPSAVAFIQNFSGAILLHPHFHVLVPDGVFSGEELTFAALPPPDDEEIQKLLRKVALKVWKVARARFPDGLPYAEDAKAALSAASAQTRLPLADEPPRRTRRCAFLEGFSLHANTHVHENDRQSLERLARSGARGPLALERLSHREDGKLEYRLRKPLPGGATTLVLTPVQLLQRLCAVMVKPRVHLTRFFGAFAPNSKARSRVVSQRSPEQAAPAAPPGTPLQLELEARPSAPRRPQLDWAASCAEPSASTSSTVRAAGDAARLLSSPRQPSPERFSACPLGVGRAHGHACNLLGHHSSRCSDPRHASRPTSWQQRPRRPSRGAPGAHSASQSGSARHTQKHLPNPSRPRVPPDALRENPFVRTIRTIPRTG